MRAPFAEGPAEAQTPYQPGMRLIGEVLRERREELGLDLDEIGAMLRIKPGYLAALEQGRSHELPGATYAIGFVRAYADFLGLNSDTVLARFKAESAGITARPDLTLPVPLGERSLPGGALVLVALILALCGYGFWYYRSTEQRDRPQRVAAVPAALQAPTLVSPPRSSDGAAPAAAGNITAPAAATPAGAAALGPAAAAPPAAGASVAPGGDLQARQPLPPTPQPQAQAQPPQSAVQAAAPPQPSAAPQPAASVASTAKIAIRALSDCWIQVRAPDQSIVFSRVLKSGEVYSVPARPGLSLRTGNAGALEIAVDGKTVPSIGGVGTLRRDVALDPKELAAGTAVHG